MRPFPGTFCHVRGRGPDGFRLPPALPAAPHDQQGFFQPHLGDLPPSAAKMFDDMGMNLWRTLVYRNGLFPLGLLAFCLGHARDGGAAVGGSGLRPHLQRRAGS